MGKCVPFGAARPCSASSWVITGMPRRVFSLTQRCTSFRKVALSRGPRVTGPWGDVGFTSLGREIWPMPWGIASFAFSGTKVPFASAIGSLLQKADTCAIFSSSVMRPSRSFTRSSTGSEASR